MVIYDSCKCPLLVAGQDYQVFPVEPVVEVGEVKSVLTRVELKDAVNKIASVKRLRRDQGPVVGVIFAYKSSYRKDVIEKTAAALQQLNDELESHEYADIVRSSVWAD